MSSHFRIETYACKYATTLVYFHFFNDDALKIWRLHLLHVNTCFSLALKHFKIKWLNFFLVFCILVRIFALKVKRGMYEDKDRIP